GPRAQDRDLPLPAGARAHGTPAGRVARLVVARGRDRGSPARPRRGAAGRPRAARGAGRGVSAPTWPDLLARLVARQDLSADQVAWAMDEIMLGQASPARLAGFLVALRA